MTEGAVCYGVELDVARGMEVVKMCSTPLSLVMGGMKPGSRTRAEVERRDWISGTTLSTNDEDTIGAQNIAEVTEQHESILLIPMSTYLAAWTKRHTSPTIAHPRQEGGRRLKDGRLSAFK